MAVSFPGTAGNYLQPTNRYGNFPTLAAWIWLNSTSPGNYRAINGRWGGGTGNLTSFLLYLEPSGQISVAITIPPSYFCLGSVLPTSQWIHVAGRWDGFTISVFIDGALDNTNSPPSLGFTLQDGGEYLIGNQGATGAPFDGVIAEPAYWSQPLLDEEISALAGGVSPSRIRHTGGADDGLLSHIPLWEDDPYVDLAAPDEVVVVGAPTPVEHVLLVGSPFSVAG